MVPGGGDFEGISGRELMAVLVDSGGDVGVKLNVVG